MGRLTKTKIDEIAKLRGKGYTQKETAEKLKVHLRTVRKYDPLHQSNPPGRRTIEDRLVALEEGVRTCWDLLDLLHSVMLRSPVLCSTLEEETFNCMRCDGKLRFDEEEATYICHNCKHKFPPPQYWCYHCLSQQEMDYIETTDEWVCRICGAKRYTC